MIDFETFKKAIETIEKYDEKDQKLHDLVGEGIGTYSCDMISIMVKLLGSHFNGDVDDWIGWWLWECNYGTEHYIYNEKDSDEDISLSDIEVFYNFLLNLYNKEG